MYDIGIPFEVVARTIVILAPLFSIVFQNGRPIRNLDFKLFSRALCNFLRVLQGDKRSGSPLSCFPLITWEHAPMSLD